jgi:hypothetical protein
MRSLLFVFATAAVAALPAQNQSLVLANGTTGHVDVPQAATLVPTSGITVEAWVTYNSALSSGWRFPTIVRMDPTPNQGSYFLRVEAGMTSANQLKWWITTTTGIYQLNWFYAAGTLSNWSHIAATYDGVNTRIFHNGVQVAQGVANGQLVNTNGLLRIGSGDLTVSGGETWNGELDELRIWPFARSAAAIAATMNLRLESIPGEVSTWNFDGNEVDTSGANHGTASGTFSYAASTRAETVLPWNGLVPVGAASGCQTSAIAAVTGPATVGNQGFGFVGFRNGGSPLGLLVLGLGVLPGPLPIFGVDLWIDPASLLLSTVMPSPLGTASSTLAIPATPALAGIGLGGQFAWFDATCAGGFSASNAVFATIVP